MGNDMRNEFLKITSRLVGLCLSVSGAKITVSAIILSVFSVQIGHAANNGQITAREILNLSVNRIVEAAASAARTYAEITYDDASLDNNLDLFTISEIFIKPINEDLPEGCDVRVGALNVSNMREPTSDTDIVNLGLEDVRISQFCMPFEWRAVASMMGVRDIEIPVIQIELKHQFKSAKTGIIVHTGANGVIDATLDIQFDYLSLDTSYYSELPINARLSSINLRIDNRGVWEQVSMQLPPEFTDPNLAGYSVRELSSEFAYLLPETIYKNFSDQIEQAINDFVANPSSLSLSSNIKKPSGLEISDNTFLYPENLLADLNLELFSGAPDQDKRITGDMISDILSGNFVNYDNEVVLTLGEAFLSGRMAPKNYDAAVLLLSYLKDNGVSRAEPLLVNAYIQQEKFDFAYEETQSLASKGSDESRALFRAIEKNLSLEKILALQATSLYLLADPYEVNSSNFYEISHGFMTGDRSLKSYHLAYYWGLLALASGDVRAETIVGQLEMLQHKLSGVAKDKWVTSVNVAQSRALDYWQAKQK